jgi:hypothetical protein
MVPALMPCRLIFSKFCCDSPIDTNACEADLIHDRLGAALGVKRLGGAVEKKGCHFL